jgi:two-component system nitrate/nitrite response regulator NarL
VVLDASKGAAITMCEVGRVLKHYPELPVVLLNTTLTWSAAEVLRAMQKGVSAYLSQPKREMIIKSVELILMGGLVMPRDVVTAMASDEREPSALSKREEQILRVLAKGLSNKAIARLLCATEPTVKVHVKNILRKLRLNNRTQAAVWCMNNLTPAMAPVEMPLDDKAPLPFPEAGLVPLSPSADGGPTA